MINYKQYTQWIPLADYNNKYKSKLLDFQVSTEILDELVKEGSENVSTEDVYNALEIDAQRKLDALIFSFQIREKGKNFFDIEDTADLFSLMTDMMANEISFLVENGITKDTKAMQMVLDGYFDFTSEDENNYYNKYRQLAPINVGINDTHGIERIFVKLAEGMILDPVESSNFYTKGQTDVLLSFKADKVDTYTKAEVDASQDSQDNKIELLEQRTKLVTEDVDISPNEIGITSVLTFNLSSLTIPIVDANKYEFILFNETETININQRPNTTIPTFTPAGVVVESEWDATAQTLTLTKTGNFNEPLPKIKKFSLINYASSGQTFDNHAEVDDGGGNLIWAQLIGATPTSDLHYTTKKYVDGLTTKIIKEIVVNVDNQIDLSELKYGVEYILVGDGNTSAGSVELGDDHTHALSFTRNGNVSDRTGSSVLEVLKPTNTNGTSDLVFTRLVKMEGAIWIKIDVIFPSNTANLVQRVEAIYSGTSITLKSSATRTIIIKEA